MTCVIGIDPGLSGGMGVYDVAADKLVEVRALPTIIEQQGRYKSTSLDEEEFAHMIGVSVEAFDVQLVLIEQVHSSPQMGVASAFKFGQGFGAVTMAAKIYAPRVEFVSPQRWKAKLMLSFDKAKSLEMARAKFGEEWFPKKKHEGMAEAALISFYAARHLSVYEQPQEEDPLS